MFTPICIYFKNPCLVNSPCKMKYVVKNCRKIYLLFTVFSAMLGKPPCIVHYIFSLSCFSFFIYFVNFCRLHAQALTLAALAGAAVVEYYDNKSGAKSDRYAKFLPMDAYAHKD